MFPEFTAVSDWNKLALFSITKLPPLATVMSPVVSEVLLATVSEASAPRVIEFTVTSVLITAGFAESITTLEPAVGTALSHQLPAVFQSVLTAPVHSDEQGAAIRIVKSTELP